MSRKYHCLTNRPGIKQFLQLWRVAPFAFRRTQSGMTTSAQPRVQSGIPSGGEFTSFGHSDKVPTLGAPTVNTDFVAHQLGEFGFADYMSTDEIAQVTSELNASRDFRNENITAVADQIHLDTAGHTVSDAIAADEGINQLTRLGHEDWAAALRRVLGRTPAAPSAVWPAQTSADWPQPSVPWPAQDTSGPIDQELTLRAAEQLRALPDGKTVPVSANDPRLLAGEVFDKVTAPDGTIFHRRRDGVFPGWPDNFRIQANRPLREAEKLKMAGLLGYAYQVQVRGEGLSMPESDTPYSFIVGTDTTKTRSDDLGMALERFEESLDDMIQNGSPVRTTNRSGPGTAGTRLVGGFNEPGLTFELYYDDVVDEH